MKQSVRIVVVSCSLALVASLSPYTAFAGPIIRSGEVVSVDASQVLEGDFYAFGTSVSISGQANNDIFVAAGNVTINGPVGGDLMVLGGVVQIHGAVADDVRVIGGEVVIAEPVKGDLVVVAGTLTVLSTATVGGDILLAGGTANIEGAVSGSIFGAGDDIRINARVGGNVSVKSASQLRLGDRADIGGSLTYKSGNELVRAQNAVVAGAITREMLNQKTERVTQGQGIALQFLILLFISLAFYLIARTRLEELALQTIETYGKQGLVGLGLILGAPLAAIILMTSIIGIMAGVAIALLYLLLLIIAWAAMPVVLGVLIMRSLGKGTTPTFISVAVGALAVTLVPLIPVVGSLAIAVLFIMVFGGCGLMLYRSLR